MKAIGNIKRGKDGFISKENLDIKESFLSIPLGFFFIPEKYPGVKNPWRKETSAYARDEYGSLQAMDSTHLVEWVRVLPDYTQEYLKKEVKGRKERASSEMVAEPLPVPATTGLGQ